LLVVTDNDVCVRSAVAARDFGMLDGLAFLPTEKVKEGMTYLRSVMQCCRLL